MSDRRGIDAGFVVGRDLRRVTALEALGVDTLWVGGHVASRNPSPEALMGLARISAVTERARIGTATLLLPLYAPAIVAKQVADLDRATGGRVVLGVGVGGEYPQEFRACQVPIEERGSRTDEAIGLLRRLWTGEATTHHGRHYTVDDVRIHPAPVQEGGPPVVVCGRKPPAMHRAALLGDGWMPYLYSARRYAASADTIRDLAAAAGRELRGFGWYAFIFVNVNADGARAREETARALGGTYGGDFAAMVDRVAAAGTPAEVAETLRQFVDAGARHFVFKTTPGDHAADDDHIVRSLLDEVLPAVREHGSFTSPPPAP